MEDKEVIGVYRKMTGERKARAFFMRKTTERLLKELNGTLQDAMVEIAQAKLLYGSQGNARSMNFGSVSGRPLEDLTAWQIDLKDRYEKWRKDMFGFSPVALSICIRVCQDEDSLESIRKDERMSWHTANHLLKYGLNEYSITAGWGNQNE